MVRQHQPGHRLSQGRKYVERVERSFFLIGEAAITQTIAKQALLLVEPQQLKGSRLRAVISRRGQPLYPI